MRRAIWSCSLAALVALAPTTATAGLKNCRLPVRSAAQGTPCQGSGQSGRMIDAQYPRPNGLASLIFGSSLFAFGIPTTIIGSLLVMNRDFGGSPFAGTASGPNAGLNILIPGALMLAVGMPMALVGAVRYERFRRDRDDWTARARIRPTASGIALHF
jgi:hypothetical protein